jgi:hypothetical protein
LRSFVCGGSGFTAGLSHAQCTNWDLGNQLTIEQRGVQLPIFLTLEQKGPVITGEARANAKGGFFDPFPKVKGTVDGTFDGNNFSVQIYWPEGLTGVYNARVLPSGRLDGETYDKNNTRIRQTWHSYGVLKCTPPPPPPAPKPIKSSGKARIQPTPPPPLKTPWIVASQVIFPAPGFPTGFVVLTWDSGPDHPDAEVLLKTPDGAATVAKQVKGGLQLTVVRGMTYEYILTDAGKILAGASFVALGP